jgi:hypothetical protein
MRLRKDPKTKNKKTTSPNYARNPWFLKTKFILAPLFNFLLGSNIIANDACPY